MDRKEYVPIKLEIFVLNYRYKKIPNYDTFI